LRLDTTTFLLNLEKQGLEDNTFTNGLGRDTTLIGNLLNVYARKRLWSSVDLDVGVFANMPFGHDTEVSQVRPIIRLHYRPTDEITTVLGTLTGPHRDFHDAVFDNANRFVRPLEQGAQILVDKGADAVIAGCSELPLVLKQERMSFPLVDTIDVLLTSAIDRCLGG